MIISNIINLQTIHPRTAKYQTIQR